MRTCLSVSVAVLVVCFVLVSPSQAGKGGKPPPAPPPDPAIAYLSSRGALMVANEDGSNQTVVLSGRGLFHGRPCWSPDGTALVFKSDIQGDGIYTIKI